MNYLGSVLPMPRRFLGMGRPTSAFFPDQRRHEHERQIPFSQFGNFSDSDQFASGPALGQAKEDSWAEKHKMRRAAMVKELKLSPDKAKDFNAVGDKYAKDRQEIAARLKKSQAELQNALAAATPDDAKLKDLVAAIRADQEKMAKSFQSQKDEDLALMTPVQQGRYLMLLHKKMKQE